MGLRRRVAYLRSALEFKKSKAAVKPALSPLTSCHDTSVIGAAAVPIDPDAEKCTAAKSATSESGQGLVTSVGPDRIAVGAGQLLHLATALLDNPAKLLQGTRTHCVATSSSGCVELGRVWDAARLATLARK